MEKSYRTYAPKASHRPLFNFAKQLKTDNACRKFFSKKKLLSNYQKTLKEIIKKS